MSQPEKLQSKLQQRLEELKDEDQGGDWLRELVEWLVQELLEQRFTEFVGAAPHERTPERAGYRNGSC